jgi:hypothetical protein
MLPGLSTLSAVEDIQKKQGVVQLSLMAVLMGAGGIEKGI